MVVLEGYDAAFFSLSPGVIYMYVLLRSECSAIGREFHRMFLVSTPN